MQIDFTTGFEVRGRDVLLLEDVVHSGVIETYLTDYLRGCGGGLAPAGRDRGQAPGS